MKKFCLKVLKVLEAIGKGVLKSIIAFGRFIAKVWKNPKGKVGLSMVGLLVVLAILAPVLQWAGLILDPKMESFSETFQAPSFKHLFGTDSEGRDILSRVIWGTQVSLMIGIFTAIGVTAMGTTMGIMAGYFGGWVDMIIMRFVDVLLVIPALPLMILLSQILGYSFTTLIFIFVILGWAGLSRTIRAQVMSLKQSNYIKAAELAGARGAYVMFKHIMPGISNLIIMSTAMSSAGFMVAEAGLSFIGLGDPVRISWGKLITEATKGFADNAWWMIIIPGLAIFFAVMSFMRVGLAIEEVLNPRMGSNQKAYKLFKNMDANTIQNAFDAMDIEGDKVPNNVKTGGAM